MNSVSSDPVPTAEPMPSPTAVPTAAPTEALPAEETAAPTPAPTAVPTAEPTPVPTAVPTAAPTAVPTAAPTEALPEEETASPTPAPPAVPTAAPTAAPTAVPTAAPMAADNTTAAANATKEAAGEEAGEEEADTAASDATKEAAAGAEAGRKNATVRRAKDAPDAQGQCNAAPFSVGQAGSFCYYKARVDAPYQLAKFNRDGDALAVPCDGSPDCCHSLAAAATKCCGEDALPQVTCRKTELTEKDLSHAVVSLGFVLAGDDAVEPACQFGGVGFACPGTWKAH